MRLFEKVCNWPCGGRVLFLLWVVALAVPNLVLSITEPMEAWARIVNVVLPLGIYGLLMVLVARVRWTAVFLAPLVFLGAFQVVLLYLYGDSIIAVDMFLNLVTTNMSEAGELLSSIMPSIIYVVLLYAPLIGFGIYALLRRQALPAFFLKGQTRLWGCVALAGTAFMGSAYVTVPGYSVLDQMYPCNVGYNIYLAIERTAKAMSRAEAVKDFSFDARSTRSQGLREAHVMVIGETSRAANFSLYGYRRPTTPLLDSDPGIVAFSRAMSQSNTTHKSVPMLLTAAGADDFDIIYSQRGILSAYKEAGYHTGFLSNQKYNRSLIDALAFEADECVFINESDTAADHHYDAALLPLIGERLRSDHQKVFIVCHTYGSHYDYYDRYPREQAFFTPDGPATATSGQRDVLMAEYDNTLRGVDAFLHSVTDSLMGSRPVSSMLYVSDHGEDIFDDARGRFLHASPTPSFHQLYVPFIVWISDSLAMGEPKMHANLLNNRDRDIETSVSAFYTMLSLGGISTAHTEDGCSAADSILRVPARKYLNDHNRAVPLLEALPDTADRQLLRKYNIRH